MNARNRKGDSPLHEAVRWSNVDASKLLVSCGAAVHCKNEQGATPVDIASKVNFCVNPLGVTCVRGNRGKILKKITALQTNFMHRDYFVFIFIL